MPLYIQPFFRKPFKLFAIDADTGQPLDPNVRKRTRVTYYELQNGSNGSKRLVAHKSPSEAPKQEDPKPEETKPAKEPKKDEGAKADDAAWAAEQGNMLKAMKENGKTWNQIAQELGRAKHQVQARWKEINPAAQGKNENAEKKDNGGGGGGGNQNQQGENNEGGKGQGKKGKKGKQERQGGNKQNNNQNNNQQANENKGEDQKGGSQHKRDDKPAAKQSNNQPANTNHEARFTMNDWLTLQEDDIFSFGELHCLSELIAKDLNQGWQRVAAKFFDLTGRRVHPDDVREKFESMAVVAEGKK